MPLYEYHCKNCDKTSEVVQKFADLPLTDCELCGGSGTLSKLISKSSFALKGTGWYTTDYKKSSAPKSDSPAASGAAPAVASVSAPVTAPAAKPKAEG